MRAANIIGFQRSSLAVCASEGTPQSLRRAGRVMTKHKLKGILPPMITPLSAPDSLDVEGVERLVEHMVRGGVHGVFVSGTTGEGPAVSGKVRRELIVQAVRQVRGRVPLLVGAIDPCYAEVLNTAKFAADAGADALVIAPLYYLHQSQADIVRYVRQMAADSPLPLLLYNVPFQNLPQFSLPVLVECSQIPGVVGFKDSSGDFSKMEQELKALGGRPDFSVLVGPEQLLVRTVALGGDGCIGGAGNLFPELLVAVYQAAAEGREAEAKRLQAVLDSMRRQLYTVGEPETALLRGIKHAAAAMGLCRGAITAPFAPFSAEEGRELERRLEMVRQEVAEALQLAPAR